MKKNNFDKSISRKLREIKSANLHRTLIEISSSMGPEIKIGKKQFYQFASNNYLGLTINPEVIKSSVETTRSFGTGTGGSRTASRSWRMAMTSHCITMISPLPMTN